jgi:apolipoprotein N-acyltransferase
VALMTTIAGLPAHALLVHAIVVLAPLTALLEILCAVWPAARRRLVWLVLAFAAVNVVLTPLTTDAGEWLLGQRSRVSAVLQTHADRGEWMIYFSVALLVVAIALAVLQWLEGRSDRRRTVANVVVAIVALLVGVSSIITVVRIGDSGAHSVWGGGG